LRQAQKMEAVGQLAGGVAHDFNNILAGIIGYADLLEHEAGASESTRHEARAIVATAQRGADLAQKLLTLARELPTSLGELDARDVVHEVHGIIKRAFDRNVEIRVDLEEMPLGVLADRTQLSNALLNLALNARDAMPQGGRLTLRARRVALDAEDCAKFVGEIEPGNYAAIVVTDTGMGMSRDVLARIFEPFFSTKDLGKGTGLGLSMVYGTVRAHGGVVDVESVQGVGSTFSIYLPALERLAPAKAPEAMPQLVKGRGEVLLADDETTVREVATRMLRRLGYAVESVADGAQAVTRFRAEPDRFAFVLLDGDMPRMHGREAARLIRELRPDIPIFLATGYLTNTAPGENAALFTAVLAKPYTLQDLSRVLSTHIAEAANPG
jgi:CheY-like chemotaxis protein